MLVLLTSFSILSENSAFAQDIAKDKPKGAYDKVDVSKSQTKKIPTIDKPQDTVIVEPIFTQAAYTKPGFYDYYKKQCDSKCLTIHIPRNFIGSYTSSGNADSVLKQNYSYITDVDVDKNPKILKKYDKVILLHNEYVTRKEFNAITSHPHVIYLYPNALYAEVSADYGKYTITLIRGHGYPKPNIANGFNWNFDNSKFEYNVKCDKWSFYKIDNGKMLNCYPENIMRVDKLLLNAIKGS